MSKYLVFVGIGFELLGLVGLGVYVSQILEAKFNSKGIITAVILVFCLIAWFIHLMFLIKKVMKNRGS